MHVLRGDLEQSFVANPCFQQSRLLKPELEIPLVELLYVTYLHVTSPLPRAEVHLGVSPLLSGAQIKTDRTSQLISKLARSLNRCRPCRSVRKDYWHRPVPSYQGILIPC